MWLFVTPFGLGGGPAAAGPGSRAAHGGRPRPRGAASEAAVHLSGGGAGEGGAGYGQAAGGGGVVGQRGGPSLSGTNVHNGIRGSAWVVTLPSPGTMARQAVPSHRPGKALPSLLQALPLLHAEDHRTSRGEGSLVVWQVCLSCDVWPAFLAADHVGPLRLDKKGPSRQQSALGRVLNGVDFVHWGGPPPHGLSSTSPENIFQC